MTIDFYYAAVQQLNEQNWHIVADFAAAINGFGVREYVSVADFQHRLREMKKNVDSMLFVAEKLE